MLSASQVQSYLFDVVGLAFTGAAIYVGIKSGTAANDFVVFATLAASYLGYKGSSVQAAAAVKAAAINSKP